MKLGEVLNLIINLVINLALFRSGRGDAGPGVRKCRE